jgi:transcriptional regulator with XRE-family HTH domain
MEKEFGDYIKDLRKVKGKTLEDISKCLNLSMSFISDIENKRRNPFDEEKMEILADYLVLTSEEKAKLYDLAAQRKQSVPDDVKNVIMFSPESDFVRLALRKTNSGELSKQDWEDFANKKKGDDYG